MRIGEIIRRYEIQPELIPEREPEKKPEQEPVPASR
jgi:hypothetical protein